LERYLSLKFFNFVGQLMTFDEAHRKEKWFFDTLFADDPEMRELCDINNFRGKLIRLYDQFVAAQIKEAAPRVFAKVIEYGKHMNRKWDWHAQQECYESPLAMVDELNRLIQGIVTNGKHTSLPTSGHEILIREDVLACAAKCNLFLDPATALQNTKQEYLRLMANVGENLIEQVHCSTKQLKFNRFLSLGCHLVKVIVFIVKQFLEQVEETFDTLISTEEKRYQYLGAQRRPVQGMVGSLIKCGQSQLSQLGAVIDNLPNLPMQYIPLDPPKILEHATPKVEILTAPFGLICGASGEVVRYSGFLNKGGTSKTEAAKIPTGSTIVQIDGTKFTLELMLTKQYSTVGVRFAYVPPRPDGRSGCSIISDDVDVSTPFLYHHEHVSCEFLEERERFLCHRRAAELLTLVFNSETTLPSGKPIATRAEFERIVNGRRLVCLDPTGGGDPDWYSTNHLGPRPSKGPTDLRAVDFYVPQPGMCCTIGCTNAHDTAFSPCGHTVCCWECAQHVDECPVCAMDLTCSARGIRLTKDLCYDHPPTELDHQERVQSGMQRDAESRQAVEDEYQQMLIKFMFEDEIGGEGRDTARLALQEHCRQRAVLAARGDGTGRLPDQACLWPRFHELEMERDRSSQEKQAIEHRMQVAQGQAAADMEQLRQTHREILQQLRLQHSQQAEAMLQYVRVLEDVLDKTDIRVKSRLLAPTESDGTAKCTRCLVVFIPGEGLLSSGKVAAYNCGACGYAFCNECAPSPGYAFQTGGKEKVQRVCGECEAALHESNGARSRLIPANRPDGTRFGS
jgi:hypothetical protein